jgi:hypothetical protein
MRNPVLTGVINRNGEVPDTVIVRIIEQTGQHTLPNGPVRFPAAGVQYSTRGGAMMMNRTIIIS